MGSRHISGVVDVTRQRIQTPNFCAWEYWSGKDKFYALKYELAVSYRRPYKIIWFNGGYKGTISDIEVYRDQLKYALGNNEYLLGDKGYLGDPSLITPFKNPHGDILRDPDKLRFNHKLQIRRQTIERINKRVKDWRLAASTWRGFNYDFAITCFYVICKLVNLQLGYQRL